MERRGEPTERKALHQEQDGQQYSESAGHPGLKSGGKTGKGLGPFPVLLQIRPFIPPKDFHRFSTELSTKQIRKRKKPGDASASPGNRRMRVSFPLASPDS